MLKRSILICSLLLLGCATKKPSIILTDITDPEFLEYEHNIRENFEIAFALYRYDMLAWTTSDSVINALKLQPALKEELGPEWFVYQDFAGNVHAVYGKYYEEEDKYVPVFHYRLYADYIIKSVVEPVDSLRCLQYARAIHNSASIAKNKLAEKGLRLNRYILPDYTGNLNVWYLPSQPNDEYQIYGADYKYVYDNSGRQLIDSVWNENRLKTVKPKSQKQITFNNYGNKYPTVDIIFCAINIFRKYKKEVNRVFISSDNYLSTLSWNPNTGYTWIHTKKQLE